MEDQFSAQISSVMSPWSGLENIMKDFEGKVHKVLESADLDKLNLGGQANIIIVNLKPVQGSSNEGKVFSDNGKISSKMDYLDNFYRKKMCDPRLKSSG